MINTRPVGISITLHDCTDTAGSQQERSGDRAAMPPAAWPPAGRGRAFRFGYLRLNESLVRFGVVSFLGYPARPRVMTAWGSMPEVFRSVSVCYLHIISVR